VLRDAMQSQSSSPCCLRAFFLDYIAPDLHTSLLASKSISATSEKKSFKIHPLTTTSSECTLFNYKSPLETPCVLICGPAVFPPPNRLSFPQ
jgi:hypothetical protein